MPSPLLGTGCWKGIKIYCNLATGVLTICAAGTCKYLTTNSLGPDEHIAVSCWRTWGRSKGWNIGAFLPGQEFGSDPAGVWAMDSESQHGWPSWTNKLPRSSRSTSAKVHLHIPNNLYGGWDLEILLSSFRCGHSTLLFHQWVDTDLKDGWTMLPFWWKEVHLLQEPGPKPGKSGWQGWSHPFLAGDSGVLVVRDGYGIWRSPEVPWTDDFCTK